MPNDAGWITEETDPEIWKPLHNIWIHEKSEYVLIGNDTYMVNVLNGKDRYKKVNDLSLYTSVSRR